MEESSSTPNFQPLRILWTAFLGAVCVYIVIAYALGQGRLASSDLTFMVPILAGAAVGMTLLAFSGGRLFAKMEYQAYCIVRWAMIESVGIFGLLLALLGASLTTAVAFCGWAVLSLFRLRPTSEDYQQFLRLRGP